jgi:hypothetical protein
MPIEQAQASNAVLNKQPTLGAAALLYGTPEGGVDAYL